MGLFLLTLGIAFIVAYWSGQAYVAYGILVGGLVILAVMSVAYMRPKGRTPEHHAEIDKIVNDTRP
jgi:hypothetical protein